MLHLIVYLKKQGDLLNQLEISQVLRMDFVKFIITSSIIARLFDLFSHFDFFVIGSLDVDFLFTNIPFIENIDNCASALFENNERVEGLSKLEFKELFSLATK